MVATSYRGRYAVRWTHVLLLATLKSIDCLTTQIGVMLGVGFEANHFMHHVNYCPEYVWIGLIVVVAASLMLYSYQRWLLKKPDEVDKFVEKTFGVRITRCDVAKACWAAMMAAVAFHLAVCVNNTIVILGAL